MKNGEKATVVIKDMPFSTNTTYNYGEYLASCVHTDWCVQMELAKKTDKVKSVMIDPQTSVKSSEKTFTFTYNPEHKELLLVQ